MATYTIKPLAWEQCKVYGDLIAKTVLGSCEVSKRYSGTLRWAAPGRGYEPCSSIEDGKAKAEAYYRERLMEALEEANSE